MLVVEAVKVTPVRVGVTVTTSGLAAVVTAVPTLMVVLAVVLPAATESDEVVTDAAVPPETVTANDKMLPVGTAAPKDTIRGTTLEV